MPQPIHGFYINTANIMEVFKLQKPAQFKLLIAFRLHRCENYEFSAILIVARVNIRLITTSCEQRREAINNCIRCNDRYFMEYI